MFKIKKIRLKFKDVFDIVVPKTFKFICSLPVRYQRSNKEDESVKGEYLLDTEVERTAEQILKGWYHPDTKLPIMVNSTEKIEIDLHLVECEYVDE